MVLGLIVQNVKTFTYLQLLCYMEISLTQLWGWSLAQQTISLFKKSIVLKTPSLPIDWTRSHLAHQQTSCLVHSVCVLYYTAMHVPCASWQCVPLHTAVWLAPKGPSMVSDHQTLHTILCSPAAPLEQLQPNLLDTRQRKKELYSWIMQNPWWGWS